MFAPARTPTSPLGYYRVLSPRCGLRVSPLCIGGMSFGDAWAGMMGSCTKQAVFELLDYYREQGGNFIDLANAYQDEQAEVWVGEWLVSRGCRDEMVIATKYTMGFKNHGPKKNSTIQANFGGNSAKSMRLSLEASLQKLQTNHVDLFYVHFWTYDTPIEEVMTYLNDLITSGKVTYLGISDTPAWIVSKANQYARDHGLRQFVVYQGKYSPLTRDLERDIMPMCRDEGMAMAHWGVLGGGSFGSSPPNTGATDRMVRVTNQDILQAMRKTLASIAEKKKRSKNVSMASIALAWAMHKAPYTFPLIGVRKIDHLKSNIEALGISLTEEEMHAIDDANPLDRGWPGNFLAPKVTHRDIQGPSDLWSVGTEVHIQDVKLVEAIVPAATATATPAAAAAAAAV